MGLTMNEQKGVAREMARRYRKASNKKKGQLIEEYMELTGCTRHHAAWLLRCWGTSVWDQRGGRPVKIVVGQRRARRRTPRVYDQEVIAALIKLWHHFGYLCGKRLAATLLLLLTVMSIVGRRMLQIIVVLGISGGIPASRIVRGAVIGVKESAYFPGGRVHWPQTMGDARAARAAQYRGSGNRRFQHQHRSGDHR